MTQKSKRTSVVNVLFFYFNAGFGPMFKFSVRLCSNNQVLMTFFVIEYSNIPGYFMGSYMLLFYSMI